MSQGIPNAGQHPPAEATLVRWSRSRRRARRTAVRLRHGRHFRRRRRHRRTTSSRLAACPKPARTACPAGRFPAPCSAASSARRWPARCHKRSAAAAACWSRPCCSSCPRSAPPIRSSAFCGSAATGPEALTAFILYRILGGVGIGVASMLSPLYIAEIAPPAQRGQLVTYQQVAIVGGMTLVYFVNWSIASQGDDQWVLSTGWRYMLLSAAIPAVLFFGLLLLVPETPRWLVMKGRMDEAQARAGAAVERSRSAHRAATKSTSRCTNAAAACLLSARWWWSSASCCRSSSSSSASTRCSTTRR